MLPSEPTLTISTSSHRNRPKRRQSGSFPARATRLILPVLLAGLCVASSIAQALSGPAQQAAQLKNEALSAANRIATSYPSDPLTHALLGSAFYNIGRSDEATRHLKKCLETRADLMDVHEILARIAYEKGDPEEAIHICEAALTHGRPTPELLLRIGRASIDLGRTEQAISALKQAAQAAPRTAEPEYLLAQAYMQAAKFKEAKEAFQKAIAKVPDHTQAWFGLFTASLRLGQEDEAEKYRQEFTRLEASDRKALTDRGGQEDSLTGLATVREMTARTLFGAAQIYTAHGDTAQALALLKRCASLDSESAIYRSALESLYLESKDFAAGIKTFQELVAEQSSNRWNLLYLGRLQARAEQVENAEKSFQQMQQLAPANPGGWRALAELYLRFNQKPEQARNAAAKCVELEPSAAHYYLLALACARTNDRAAAVAAAKQALLLNPREKRYIQLLQQLGAAR